MSLPLLQKQRSQRHAKDLKLLKDGKSVIGATNDFKSSLGAETKTVL